MFAQNTSSLVLLELRKWFLLSFFFIPCLIFGQKAQIEYYPSGEFLSSLNPWRIHQDQTGFIWVMGQSVDRYDGNNFVNIKDQESTWNDYNYLEYQNHFTSGDYLIYRSDSHFFFRQIKTGIVDSIYFENHLNDEEIINENFFFHETAKGAFYFFFFEPATQKTAFLTIEDGKLKRKFSRPDVGRISDPDHSPIDTDTQGNFYYINKEATAIIKIDQDGNLLQKTPLPNMNREVGFFKVSSSNTLYLKGNNQIYYLKENATAIEIHPLNDYIKSRHKSIKINDLLETSNKDLWASGYNRRLFFYEEASGKIVDYQDDLLKLIPHRVSLNQLLQDQTGVIWVKIQQLGILKIVPQQSFFETYFTEPDCDGFCSFRGMVENEEGQIFASFYHGIYQLDPQTKTTEKLVPSLEKYGPFGLGYDKGHLLLNSGRRFNISKRKIDEQSSLFPKYNSDDGPMTQDDDGNWWNGQEEYLWFFNTKNKIPKWEKKIRIPIAEGHTYSIHFGKTSKRIWIANESHLFCYDPSNNTIAKYFSIDDDEMIHTIYEDEKRNLWLGTELEFMQLEPHQKVIKKYSTEDGMPHNFVCGILPEGDSCLWLATNDGLSRFQMEQETFTNFYTEHGLSHNEFNRNSSYKSKNGQMFFGGMRGVNAFYPKEVMEKLQKQKKTLGEIMLSSVSRADEKLGSVLTTHLEINNKTLDFFHWEKSITFEFCLTDFRNSNKNTFSYLLDGYDEVWSTPSKYKFAKYTSLPAGDYVFRVKTFDGRGNWNPNELEVQLKVHSPWWKTSWAYLVYTLFFCGTFYIGYRTLRHRMELTNQVFFEQKETQRLKELDSFKSKLFTSLTHEFRTPLTVILGMSEQVSKKTRNLKIEENEKLTLLHQTELIEKNGHGLLRLVNQLLDLSKLENNVFTLDLKNENVLPFLNGTIASFQSFANQQNIALKYSTTLDALDMDFDSRLLEQVLTNLLSNAIKFTESGGIILVKSSRLQLNDNYCLQIMIQDSGVGISEEKLPHIFDRFYQVDGPNTRAGEGTGIGLAHAKELVKLMNGDITVESKLGQGTTFWISIPIKNEIEKMEHLDQSSIGENSSHRFTFDEKRINKVANKNRTSVNRNGDLPKLLLIEDNQDVVIYIKSCLEEKYEIEVAYNGKIGIEKAIQQIPDLIISDVMMPEKDGFEVCDFLKNDDKTSHIPIVLLTAKADFTSKIEGLKRGADVYLPKPFNQEELEVRLHSLLLRQQRMINYISNHINNGKKELSSSSAQLSKKTLQLQHVFIQKIESILEENYTDKDFTLSQLCQKIRMSRSQLFRKMKALTGTSPSLFIRTYRLKKAKLLLESTDLNVSEVAWKTGFTSLSHFSRIYQEEFGRSPSSVST